MKKIDIVCVGKIKEKFITQGIEEYKKRISKFATLNIVEVPDSSIDELSSEIESKMLLEKLDSYVILLDLKGNEISSEELSKDLDKAFLFHSKVQFVIGGSRGVNEQIIKRANKIIRFGKITYPHMLMRLILTEQIYRALTISNGLPYHK